MLGHIARFEVRYHLRHALFYICVVIFFLLTFGAVTSDSVQIGGAIGNVNRNAPFVIMQFSLVMSIIGVFVTTAFVANAIYRDFEHNTASLFFSSPLKKSAYLGGRFIGSTLVAFFVFFAVEAAIAIGSTMPWLEPERIGPFDIKPYLFSLFVIVLPNIVLTAAVFFSVAALTRSMLATYVAVVAFFVAYLVSANFLGDMQNDFVASILDPFGGAAFSVATKYWTVAERNTSVLPIAGVVLINRLLWLSVAAAIFAFTFFRFRMTADATLPRKKSKKTQEVAEAQEPSRAEIVVPAVTADYSRGASIAQYFRQSKLEFLGVVKGLPFLVMLALGAMNIFGNSTGIDQFYGTPVYPVTGLMLNVIAGAFLLFAIIIVTFYSGELAFRERSLKMNEVYDALPVPTSVFWGAKLTALIGATATLLLVAMVTAIGIQAGRGYTNFEPALYLKGLFLTVGIPFALICVLAFFAQVITNNKYVGFLVVVLYFISGFVLPSLGLEHNLYQYAAAPDSPYSDMNGYGHFGKPLFWFYLYWTFFAVALLVATHLLWVRGTEAAWIARKAGARSRFRTLSRTVLTLALIGFVSTGCYIYYNTNVVNRYVTQKDREKTAAETEKQYKKYEGAAQPKIVAAKADVDIYPRERRTDIRGEYTLHNTTRSPISELYVTISPESDVRKITLPPGSFTTQDKDHGFSIYTLKEPLQPGARATMKFDVGVDNPGFVNSGSNTKLVYNGTFFNNFDYMPHIGYSRQVELQDRSKRKKHGLKPVQRYAKPDDMKARMNNYVVTDVDWMTFETTVSTSEDQIALAPGYLEREWKANGRRYFHYKMDRPILGFFSYLSADWKVKRDKWNDVAIEIYYDEKHPYNVDRMIYGVQKSLDYFTANFSPYQHRQVRIVEFPRYARFAQSFPNTIPFSESIGFIANLKKKDAIDYVFYVTAHEVAHQWWAHQVVGGDVQGSTVLSETLSQYSALMVMEKEYGRDQMRRFLRYELDRYLRGRGGELIEELPLALVENQPYVHYNKGSLIMYALRDLIGEDKVNAALRDFIAKKAYQQPPYTTSLELLQEIRRVAPREYQGAITDLFERITIFENRATKVTSKKRPDGTYLVAIDVEAKKFHATGGGKENPVPLDDWIDVGVVLEKKVDGVKQEKVLAMEKRRMTSPKAHFEFVVKEEPTRAGIDPLNKLIDRNPEDNTKKIETAS